MRARLLLCRLIRADRAVSGDVGGEEIKMFHSSLTSPSGDDIECPGGRKLRKLTAGNVLVEIIYGQSCGAVQGSPRLLLRTWTKSSARSLFMFLIWKDYAKTNEVHNIFFKFAGVVRLAGGSKKKKLSTESQLHEQCSCQTYRLRQPFSPLSRALNKVLNGTSWQHLGRT